MVVPPASPIETTSSEVRTSESSVRRVRPRTLAPPATFYTPRAAPKPPLDGAHASLSSSGGTHDVSLGATFGERWAAREERGLRGEDGRHRPRRRSALGSLPVPDRRLVPRDPMKRSPR